METATDATRVIDPTVPLPLERCWYFWLHKPCFDGHYEKSRLLLHTQPIATVQDFWEHYNTIWAPSRFLAGKVFEGYGFFEQNVQPDWEHPAHKAGATLTFKAQFEPQEIDQLWCDVLLYLIGQTLPLADQVTGLRVLRRNQNYRLEVWCKRANDLDPIQTFLAEWINDICDGKKPKGLVIFPSKHSK